MHRHFLFLKRLLIMITHRLLATTVATLLTSLSFASESTWAFTPDQDRFRDDALLDLRHLNEKTAGDHGFIRRSRDGASFVRGDGKEIRFWATNSYIWRHKRIRKGKEEIQNSQEDMNEHARFIAKRGVNMVRLHADVAGRGEGQRLADVDEFEIEGIFRFVAACKQEGIYLTVSPHWYKGATNNNWGQDLPGYDKKAPAASLFFNPVYQEAYKGWIKELFTRVNPHTGVALKDDPAVAIIQVINEDSLLFWTFQAIPEPQQRILNQQWSQWLIVRHGSLADAVKAWQGEQLTNKSQANGDLTDQLDRGLMGMYKTHILSNTGGSQGRNQRVADQLRFMTELQYNFYAEIGRYLREDLGCKQLINATNWKTAEHLDDLEPYTYTALDVIARNAYMGSDHTSKNKTQGYRIDPGDEISYRSVLRTPLRNPLNRKQIAGYPFLITESGWVNPNLYKSEGPFLVSAYQSLTGIDGFYWFALSSKTWDEDPRASWWHVDRSKGPDGHATMKWNESLYDTLGMFPANALLFRQGYLKQGDPAVHEVRDLENLYALKAPIIAETATFDPNRDLVDRQDASAAEQTDVSRFAFLVGPVQMSFGNPKDTKVIDLSRYIDSTKEVVTSNTGELAMHYGKHYLLMDAPKAQGVTGFLKEAGGSFSTKDVVIETQNDYAAIQVVSMDDKPLAQSARILVQVGTTARLTNWETRPADKGKERIVATGRPPFQVAATQATITVRNARLKQATLLDVNGYTVNEVPVEVRGGAIQVELPHNTMYLVLH